MTTPITSPISYLGATDSELRQRWKAGRLRALSDQRRLFPHQGLMRVEPDALAFEGWRQISRSDVTAVDVAFTDVYTRFMAGGARGNAASFGLFGSLGKPLILALRNDEPVYLLLEFRQWLGINNARKYAPSIRHWRHEEPR